MTQGAVGSRPRRCAPVGTTLASQTAFLAPAFGLLAVLVVYPLGHSIVTSLFDRPASLVGGEFVGLANYATLLSDGRFWAATARTFGYTFAAIAIQIPLGIAYALLLHQRFRGRKVLRTIFMIPMIATPVAVAMVWRLMFQPDLGVLNILLRAVGLPGVAWTSDPVLVMPALVLVDVWQWTPLVAIIVLAGLASLPQDVDEAARVDGANAWQKFWSITLPALRPVIAVAAVMRVIEAMRAFDPIYVITGGGPGQASETLNLYAYQIAFQFLRPGYAAAVVLVFLVFMVIASLTVVTIVRRSQ